MSDLDDFMAENTPTFRLKLQPYLSDIQTLWQHGYSEPDILRYLSEKKNVGGYTKNTTHFYREKHSNQDTDPPNGCRTAQADCSSKEKKRFLHLMHLFPKIHPAHKPAKYPPNRKSRHLQINSN